MYACKKTTLIVALVLAPMGALADSFDVKISLPMGAAPSAVIYSVPSNLASNRNCYTGASLTGSGAAVQIKTTYGGKAAWSVSPSVVLEPGNYILHYVEQPRPDGAATCPQ